mmetsp:Transcript_4324/g.9810  ORF Transcript_4324/g.9810 Transcript_4324/m.9810 type:complete len:220 (-) Transcript_4324:192-851(-)
MKVWTRRPTIAPTLLRNRMLLARAWLYRRPKSGPQRSHLPFCERRRHVRVAQGRARREKPPLRWGRAAPGQATGWRTRLRPPQTSLTAARCASLPLAVASVAADAEAFPGTEAAVRSAPVAPPACNVAVPQPRTGDRPKAELRPTSPPEARQPSATPGARRRRPHHAHARALRAPDVAIAPHGLAARPATAATAFPRPQQMTRTGPHCPRAVPRARRRH